MDDHRLGSLIRAIRMRRGLRQLDLARTAGVGQTTISLVERGHWETLSARTLRRVPGPLDMRIDVAGRWRGGDSDRLLSRRHSELAEALSSCISSAGCWRSFPEVSFSIYGERGVIDQLAWHADASHLLVIELKTEFTDMNEVLGTLDRKARLARAVARERGMEARLVSEWLIVSDTSTNRRHARQHASLLAARFRLDGRSFRALLRKPSAATTGLAFWPRSIRCASGVASGRPIGTEGQKPVAS